MTDVNLTILIITLNTIYYLQMDLMFRSNRAEYGGQPAEMEANDVSHTTSQCKMYE